MPNFHYKAIDNNGREVSDTLAASSRAIAMDMLFQKNLSPIEVNQQQDHKQDEKFSRIGKVRKSDVESFTRELANLLAAGVDLSRALSIISREAAGSAARK